MRTIVFPAGTHDTTKRVITAVAWATNRRGRVPWKTDNVVRSVHQYLTEQGVEVTSQQVSTGIQWLVRHGYVRRRLHDSGQRTLELAFHDDVDLSGFMPHFTRRRSELPRILVPATAPAPSSNHVTTPTVTTTKFSEPPLPFAEQDARDSVYRWDDLHDVAARWFLRDPEGWSDWVDRVIDRLNQAEDSKEMR